METVGLAARVVGYVVLAFLWVLASVLAGAVSLAGRLLGILLARAGEGLIAVSKSADLLILASAHWMIQHKPKPKEPAKPEPRTYRVRW